MLVSGATCSAEPNPHNLQRREVSPRSTGNRIPGQKGLFQCYVQQPQRNNTLGYHRKFTEERPMYSQQTRVTIYLKTQRKPSEDLHLRISHKQIVTLYRSFRALCYVVTSVTPTNTQFYNPCILSIIWLLHILALLPSARSLKRNFINPQVTNVIYIWSTHS